MEIKAKKKKKKSGLGGGCLGVVRYVVGSVLPIKSLESSEEGGDLILRPHLKMMVQNANLS